MRNKLFALAACLLVGVAFAATQYPPEVFPHVAAVVKALKVAGDDFNRYEMTPGGVESWGPGNAAVDTNLYRSTADTLKTDDSFTVAGVLTASGDVVGDGADQFYGFLHDQVASTTVAVTAAQADKTFVSNSADTMTLPEASTVLGARYTFVCGTADDFVINPADGTDVIGTVASITGSNTTTVLAPSAGDSITCTDIGSSVVLEAVGANLWASIGNANGIWTDTN